MDPIDKNDTVMYRFDLEGYTYGAALPIDITWWDITIYIDGLIHRQVNKNRNCEQAGVKLSQYYKGNDLVLKFVLIGLYCKDFCLY